MVEGDFAADRGHLFRIFLVGNRHRLVHGFKDTLQIGDVVDEVVENVSQVHDGLPEEGSVAGDRHDGSEGFVSLSENHEAEEENRGPDADGDRVDARPHQVGVADSRVPGPAAVLGKILENPGIFVLTGENLGDSGADNVLLKISVQVGVLVGNSLPGFSLFVFDPDHENCENRHAAENDEGQLHIHQEHENHDEKQVEGFQHDVDQSVGEHIRDGVYIVDHADQDFAVGAVIVILEGQLLKVLEQVFTDIINDILAHLYHDLAADR